MLEVNRRQYRWRDTPKIDKSGITFNYLTVLNFSHYELKSNSKGRKLIWNCLCRCGNTLNVENSNLICGNIKSCGCFKVEKLKQTHKKLIKQDAAFNSVYKEYRDGANKRNIKFNLSKDQVKQITKNNCYYCGCNPKTIRFKNGKHIFKTSYIYNGIDRVINDNDYSFENCVACCADCNISKGTKTVLEFLNWIHRVYKYQNKNGSINDH